MSVEPYCVKESAKHTGIPVGTLYRLARLGEIPHHWEERQLRFLSRDLDAFLSRPETERERLTTF